MYNEIYAYDIIFHVLKYKGYQDFLRTDSLALPKLSGLQLTFHLSEFSECHLGNRIILTYLILILTILSRLLTL